jgi:Fe-S-cluster containining protein
MSEISSLLSADDCRECRLCCWFTQYDLWETPVITPKLRELIEGRFPDVRFFDKGGGNSLFVMDRTTQTDMRYEHYSDGERYDCPMLGVSGCKLYNDKPFECAIWPFRIMSQGDKRLISVSTLCTAVCKNSLQAMMDLLENGLKQKIADYADTHPGIVKPYNDGYPILMYI